MVLLACAAPGASCAAETENWTASTVLSLAAHSYDVVKLEVENNDGQLLVGTGSQESFGAVKLLELTNRGGDLLIRLSGGTEGLHYRVSLQLWNDERPNAPVLEYRFDIEGAERNVPRTEQVFYLREVGGALNVQVFEQVPVVTKEARPVLASAQRTGNPDDSNVWRTLGEGWGGDAEAGRSPVSTRYDARNNLIVDMAYWDTDESSLTMTYGNRAGLRTLGSSARAPYEQVAVNLEAPVSTGRFYARTEQGVAPNGQSSRSGINAEALRLLQYGFSGESGKLGYGADYSYAGSEYENFLSPGGGKPERDRERSRLWAKWPLGNRLSLEASTGQQRKDLDRGLDKPHYIDQVAGLSTNLVLSHWPYLSTSVWYKEGERNTEYAPEGKAHYQGEVQTSGASLYFQNGWSGHGISASYSDTYDQLRPARFGESVSHYFYSNLYPTDTISLGAAVSINEDLNQSPGYLWSGTYTSESVWATIAPPQKNFSLSWSGYVDGYATLDGSTEYSGFYSNVTLAFDELMLFDERMPLAFTVQYADYIDKVYPSANTEGITFWLQLGRSPAFSRQGSRRRYLNGPLGPSGAYR